MGSLSGGAQAQGGGSAPTMMGTVAPTPQNIALQPQTPENLGLDPTASPQAYQQLLGNQPLAVK